METILGVESTHATHHNGRIKTKATYKGEGETVLGHVLPAYHIDCLRFASTRQ
jgi:hypothetical protein